MCGRYHITRPIEAVAEVFDALIPDEVRRALDGDSATAAAPTALGPRYNIAPTQMVAIIRLETEGPQRGRRILDFAHWGLVPAWAKDTSRAANAINARSETVAEKPSFRAAFRHRRCLMPTSGFFEWQTLTPAGTTRAVKQPHRIFFRDERLMVMAGLFEVWQAPDGSALGSCAMLTTSASASMDGLHARMPVVLDSEDEWDAWLAPGAEPELLHSLCRPFNSPDFVHHPVDRAVGQVRNQGPGLLHAIDEGAAPSLQEPAAKPAQGSLF
ncbi:MAG: SOS response-associated peptidase [Alphaproteobacteria bacterium]